MRKLFESPELLQVQLVASFLENEGIRASLANEHQAGNPSVPHWAIPVNAELWILNPAQYDQAFTALAQYRENRGRKNQGWEVAEEWTCASCGKANPGNFQHCWQCGGDAGNVRASS